MYRQAVIDVLLYHSNVVLIFLEREGWDIKARLKPCSVLIEYDILNSYSFGCCFYLYLFEMSCYNIWGKSWRFALTLVYILWSALQPCIRLRISYRYAPSIIKESFIVKVCIWCSKVDIVDLFYSNNNVNLDELFIEYLWLNVDCFFFSVTSA